MKRVYVNEKWCLACRLCEYYCAFAEQQGGGASDERAEMSFLLKNARINPKIKIEEQDGISFAVQCRHCPEPLCVKGCLTGALSQENGLISIDKEKCVGCYTCVVCCPYGAVMPTEDGPIQKCELCVQTKGGEPMCVKGCPNGAIVFEDRG